MGARGRGAGPSKSRVPRTTWGAAWGPPSWWWSGAAMLAKVPETPPRWRAWWSPAPRALRRGSRGLGRRLRDVLLRGHGPRPSPTRRGQANGCDLRRRAPRPPSSRAYRRASRHRGRPRPSPFCRRPRALLPDAFHRDGVSGTFATTAAADHHHVGGPQAAPQVVRGAHDFDGPTPRPRAPTMDLLNEPLLPAEIDSGLEPQFLNH